MYREESKQAAARLRDGLLDPDRFFEERGITLRCVQREGAWWAEWTGTAHYGRGETEQEAKESAVRRWMNEQEAPDLRRLPGEPLP
jgi:hypothetical protein